MGIKTHRIGCSITESISSIIYGYSRAKTVLINHIFSILIAILHLNVRADLILMHSTLNTTTTACICIITTCVALGQELYSECIPRLGDWKSDRFLYFRILRISVRRPIRRGGGSRAYSDLGAALLIIVGDRNSDCMVRDQGALAVGFWLIVVRSVNWLSNRHSNLALICNQGSVQGDGLFGTKPIIQS